MNVTHRRVKPATSSTEIIGASRWTLATIYQCTTGTGASRRYDPICPARAVRMTTAVSRTPTFPQLLFVYHDSKNIVGQTYLEIRDRSKQLCCRPPTALEVGKDQQCHMHGPFDPYRSS